MKEAQKQDLDELNFLLKKSGMTQIKFARLIDATPATVSMTLSGKTFPSPALAARMAFALFQKPHNVFRTLFSGEFDPSFGSPLLRKDEISAKPVSDLIVAKRVFRENENELSVEQCRILAQSFGLNLWRCWPERFSRLGHELPTVARPQKAPARSPSGGADLAKAKGSDW